jgi:hypothetical protein
VIRRIGSGEESRFNQASMLTNIGALTLQTIGTNLQSGAIGALVGLSPGEALALAAALKTGSIVLEIPGAIMAFVSALRGGKYSFAPALITLLNVVALRLSLS